MRKTKFLALMLLAASLWSCQNEVEDVSAGSVTEIVDPSLINKSEEVDGVRYTLKNVSLNSKLVVLNDANSRLISVDGDLFQLEISVSDLVLEEGNTLYLQSAGQTYLLKVNSLQKEGNVYTLRTEATGLGSIFESGSLELAVDVDKATRAVASRSASSALKSNESGIAFDIFEYVEPFNFEGFAVNLNSSLKAFYNVKLGFRSSYSLLPNEVEVTYELVPSFNPYFTSATGVNAVYEADFAENIPTELSDLLKTIDISIDIPLGDLGTLPASIGVEAILIPSEFAVNASQQVDFKYNVDGVFKVGYAYYNNVEGKTSHAIYENSMIASNVNDIRLNGEISSDIKVVIVPRISIIENDLLKVGGQLSFGINTFTSGGVSLATNEYNFGSVGTFDSKASINVKSLGLSIFNVDLLNDSKELWNVGTFDKSFAISNLKLAKPSKTQCSLRSYNFDITAAYQYPVYGKLISNTVEVTYDVYDDNKSLLAGNQKVTLSPTNVTASNFTFSLCIPFRINALGITSGFTRNTGYIRNLKITDALGNVAEGPAEIAIGSPYNNSFWK